MRCTFTFVLLLSATISQHASAPASVAQDQPIEQKRPAISQHIEEVIWWLPEDTETLLVSQSFVVPRRNREDENAVENPAHEATIAEIMQGRTLFPFAVVQNGAYWNQLRERKVSFAVEGARRFRFPQFARDTAVLGLMPYQGCHVIAFEEEKDEERNFVPYLANSLARGASKVITVADLQVAVFSEKLGGLEWNFFFAQPKPNILLAATDENYLEEVLKRMDRKQERRALPNELPEWQHVDPTAPVWAIRHYVRWAGNLDPRNVDPSSPLKGGSVFNDDKAIGVAFSAFPGGRNVAEVKHLSNNKDALKITRELWTHPTQNLTPLIRETEKGCIEVSVPLDDKEARSMFIFVLLGVLGHGVFI